MNQQDIDKYLDGIISSAEKDIDRAFAATLKEILNDIAAMYQKYANGDGTLTWTDLNKFNRLQQEMTMISGTISKQYADVLSRLQSMTQTVYLENFMRSSYLYELAAQTPLGVSVPSMSEINQAIQNPIDKLTLPNLMQSHQTDIINKLHIAISQSLMAGEGYALMARRIQQAVNFNQAKARNVARTEGGRVATVARLNSAEQAAKHADLKKVWNATLDLRTRPDHRKLDGQEADKDGYFHIHEFKAQGPHLFGVAKEDCNCRCTVIMKVNGQLPDSRRARDYTDADYQQRLADRMDQLMADEVLTEKQAEKQAQKEIQPLSKAIPYQSYEEWLSGKKKSAENKADVSITMPDGSKRVAKVDKSSGIPIVQPADLDHDLQTLTTDDVKGFINQIPKEHQGVIKEIHLLDDYDRDGDKEFDSAVGGFDLKSKNIELYRNDWLNEDTLDKTLGDTVRHETAHALQETLGGPFLKDWKKAMKKDGASITDYAKTDIYEDIAETIMYHWSPDSIERRTVEMFFPERYSVLKKWGIKSGHNKGESEPVKTPNKSSVEAVNSVAKTNMEERVGQNNYNQFIEHLNSLKDAKLQGLFEKYADQIEFKKLENVTAYTNGSVVQLAQVDFKGDRYDNPLQTVYHEIGHAFDGIGLRTITGKSLYPTGNKIKIKHNGRMVETDEYVTVLSAIPKYQLRDTVERDLWEYVNGKDFPMIEDIGNRPRKKAEKAAWDKKYYGILDKSRANFANFEKEIVEKYGKDSKEIAILSDIYESTPFTSRSMPFGSGHGKAYYNKVGLAEAEFFAQVAETRAANKESFDMLNEIFPNAVKVWETIVDDMLKAGD